VHKLFLIFHGPDPHSQFGSWTPHRCVAWHTHPLAGGDSLVALRVRDMGVMDELEAMETQGLVTLWPSMTSGRTLDDHNPQIAKHAALRGHGVLGADRTYDAALKAHASIAFGHAFHPER